MIQGTVISFNLMTKAISVKLILIGTLGISKIYTTQTKVKKKNTLKEDTRNTSLAKFSNQPEKVTKAWLKK